MKLIVNFLIGLSMFLSQWAISANQSAVMEFLPRSQNFEVKGDLHFDSGRAPGFTLGDSGGEDSFTITNVNDRKKESKVTILLKNDVRDNLPDCIYSIEFPITYEGLTVNTPITVNTVGMREVKVDKGSNCKAYYANITGTPKKGYDIEVVERK